MSIAPQYRTGTDRFFAGILDGMVLRLLVVLTTFHVDTEWESYPNWRIHTLTG